MRYQALTCLCAILIGGCSGTGDTSDVSGKRGLTPAVILSVPSIPPTPLVPWAMCGSAGCVSAAVLMPGDHVNPVPEEREIIMDAAGSGLLIAVVDDSVLSSGLGDDHLKIWTDAGGAPVTWPENILSSDAVSSWSDPVERQEILFKLFDLYKPDLVFIRLHCSDAQDQIDVAEFWTDEEILLDHTVALYSIPPVADRRGWAIFAGRGINGTAPMGLTAGGVFSTLRLISGLDWDDHIPDRIPALAILSRTEDIWIR